MTQSGLATIHVISARERLLLVPITSTISPFPLISGSWSTNTSNFLHLFAFLVRREHTRRMSSAVVFI